MDNDKVRKLKVILFCGIGCLIFAIMQRIFTPKWLYPRMGENVQASIETFYDLPSDSIDIVFVGASHMEFGVNPVLLYENDGIKSYNLATSGQPVDMTELLIKEAFKHQSPKYVIMDVSTLFCEMPKNMTMGYNYILDNVHFSYDKMVAIKNLISRNPKIFYEVLSPMNRYHSRWSEIEARDFDIFNNRRFKHLMGGYFMNTVVSPGISPEQMNDAYYQLFSNKKEKISFDISKIDDSKITVIDDKLPYFSEIPKDKIAWLQNVIRFCNEKNAELILVKIPSVNYPQVYTSSWTIARSNMVRKLASDLGIFYYDFLYDNSNLDIDWASDSVDSGGHLNYYGALKMTEYMRQFILSYCKLTDGENAYYDDINPLYNEIVNLLKLGTSSNILEYSSMLNDMKDDLLILMAACDDMSYNMNSDIVSAFSSLGLDSNILNNLEMNDSYIVAINKGNVITEASSNLKIKFEDCIDDLDIEMISSGWKTQSMASIKINGKQYSLNRRGINFVIYNYKSHTIVDIANFDIFAGNPFIGVHDFSDCLQQYIFQMMESNVYDRAIKN